MESEGEMTMSKILTFQERLDCPHSFNSEDNKNLQCDYEFCEICDGTLWEHCMWDMSEKMQMIVHGRLDHE